MRIIKVFIVVVGVFLICMFFIYVFWIWYDFGWGWESVYFKDVLIFSNILMYVNSVLNFFIFGFLRNFFVCKCWWKEL